MVHDERGVSLRHGVQDSRLRSFSANEDLSPVQPLLFLLMKGELSSAASVLESLTGVKSLSPSMALTVAGSTSPPLPPSEPPDPYIGVAFPVDPPDPLPSLILHDPMFHPCPTCASRLLQASLSPDLSMAFTKLDKSLDMKPLKLILTHLALVSSIHHYELMRSRSGPSIGWKPDLQRTTSKYSKISDLNGKSPQPPICPSQKMPLEPFKNLQVTIMQAPPHHQAVPARNTHNERLPNPPLRALILPLQDVYVDARLSTRLGFTKLDHHLHAVNILRWWLSLLFREEPALLVAVVRFIPKMSSQVHHQRSTPTRVIIKPISTSFINQPPKANKITSSSATLFHNPKRQKLTLTSPVTLTIMVKFTQTSSRQGRERSSSTSSFQERIFSPQSLFVRGNSHPNTMISAHSCGIKSRSLEALFKSFRVLPMIQTV
ncbi:hypothetical protein HID58_034204 [Brassica napus]|uniref:Uncharacterized protein n=1 Tax=Brassica napus TaxID=3708 RepID=A0ABQ8C2P3_BRANA|nr:hypothetical protein HID58_034204 [Brassica napus]